MKRRCLLLLAFSLTLIGSATIAWFTLAQRDADFVVVGPRTRGVRAHFAALEKTINPLDLRDCRNVRDALARLSRMLEEPVPVPMHEGDHFGTFRAQCIEVDEEALAKNLLNSPFQIPDEPMTAKQLLRATFVKAGAPHVHFIVRGYLIEATTAERAQEERARYLDSVGVYDRTQTFWKEMTGTIEDVEPLVVID